MSRIDPHPKQKQIFQQLLQCLQVKGEEIPGALNYLSPTDWEQMVHLATRLGVANLLYYQIQHHPLVSLVPSPLVGNLREVYRKTAFDNLERYRELNRVLNGLKRAGITPIALKGILLAQTVYGNVALRSMNDIDLLVKREDVSEAENCLVGLGYRLDEKRKLKKWYLDNHFHVIFELADKPIRIELHWNLVRPDSNYRVDLEKLWQRSEWLQIVGVEVRAFSNEDLLIYLCAHASRHTAFNFYAFRSIIDIHRLIERNQDELDWDRLIHLANEWKAVNSVYITLRLTQKFMGTVIPVDVLNTLNPAGFEPCLLEWAEERVIEEGTTIETADNLNPNLATLSKRYDHTLLTRSIRDKLNSLVRLIFINKEDIAEIYSLSLRSPRIYLYYLVRLTELLKRYSIPSLWLFLGDPVMQRWAEQERKHLAIVRWIAFR